MSDNKMGLLVNMSYLLRSLVLSLVIVFDCLIIHIYINFVF